MSKTAFSKLVLIAASVGIGSGCDVWLHAAVALGREITPKGGDYTFLNTTKPADFLGRWKLVSEYREFVSSSDIDHGVSVDIVGCRKSLCGILVSPAGTCQGVVFTIVDHHSDPITGANEDWDRYSGNITWTDSQKYEVRFDIDEDNHERSLRVQGALEKSGYGGRGYPFELGFHAVGRALCTMPTS